MPERRRVVIAADQLGLPPDAVKAHREAQGVAVVDIGVNAADRIDYPDLGRALAEKISAAESEHAIASSNAQVITQGAQITGISVAEMLVDMWLKNEFQAERSGTKVAKIDAVDRDYRRAHGSAA